MKKLLALLLMLTLAFALVACGDDPVDPVDPEPTPEEIFAAKVNEFSTAVAATSPTTSTITVKSENADYGELNATFNVTYNEDGSITVNYSVDRLGESIDEDFIVTETGTVTCDKDGNYVSGTDFSGTVSAPTVFTINLDLFENIRIEGASLFGKVSAANTAAAIGVELDTDANVVVVKNAGKITAMVASYEKNGTTVTINCNFN